MVTRTQSDCLYIFSLENIVFIGQEKQNPEDLVKNRCIFDYLNLVSDANLTETRFRGENKKNTYRFVKRTWKKTFGPTVSEKKRKNLDFVAQSQVL